MKKVILIFILFVFNQNLSAQVFSVGNTCCNYNLVNKTFTVNATPCVTVSPDFYGFDIDGDAIEDIRITSFNNPPCFAGGAQSKGIMMTSTTGCEVAYSTAVTCPFRFLINLSFGTPMNTSLNWSVTPATWNIGQPSPYLYYEYINPSSVSYNCGNQVNPFYAGFRKILTNDTIYGWVLMDTNFPGILYSYAFEHTNLSIGINSINNYKKTLVVYPNPNSGEFEIKSDKETSIVITNELSQLVKTVKLNSENNFSSKITELQSGVYFIGSNSARQKIVVIK